jgi:hypothetical protein
MKIFLSQHDPSLSSHKWIPNLNLLNDAVLDCEATDIICDNFLSAFMFNECAELLKIIVSKMRLNSQLTIIETDANLASGSFYRQETDLSGLNGVLFNSNRKSIFTSDYILSILFENIDVTNIHFDANKCGFIIKCRRSK